MPYADPQKQREYNQAYAKKAWAETPREKKLAKQAAHREARRIRYATDPKYRDDMQKEARLSYFKRVAKPEGRVSLRKVHAERMAVYRATPEGWASLRISTVKQRAKKENLEFDLALGDFATPDTCPDLGIPLVYALAGGGRRPPGVASLDRIDASKGYVRGNVRVISFRANRLKQDATCAELEALLAGMRRAGCP